MKNKSLLLTIAISLIAMSSFAQVKGSFTDSRDGKIYKTVSIGTQTWMAENLAYKASSGCWSYDNNATNVTIYGYLYEWETAKKVCPSGWHLPSDAEWTTLTDNIGDNVADEEMKSTSGWNEDGNGTNNSGFTALPGGYRNLDETFGDIGNYGGWWSSTENSVTGAYYRNVTYGGGGIGRLDDNKAVGFSVRCVMDK
jgi:uncharacterized protein (TIGR02145 family)